MKSKSKSKSKAKANAIRNLQRLFDESQVMTECMHDNAFLNGMDITNYSNIGTTTIYSISTTHPSGTGD